MYKSKKILALIPARKGSKGLLLKNIRPLLGRPLIAWSIETALASSYLDRIIVSTDSEEIAKVSINYKAEVPFIRPRSLSGDNTPTIDVILHALKWLKERGESFDYLVLLEPTSPLREAKDIDKAIRILINNNTARSVVSVARLESAHPEFNVVIDKKSGFIKKMLNNKDFKILRRQELTDVYFFEGTIYISEIETLRKKKTFYHNMTLPYVVPRWKSLEIDELPDLLCAEALLKARQEHKF